MAQAAYGVLTSGRAIDILAGPTRTGKTRTVAAIARIWREAGVIAAAADKQSKAVARMRVLNANPGERLGAEQDADYLEGVIATLNWVLGEGVAPITRAPCRRDLISRDLKTERLHAQDVINQAGNPWMDDPPRSSAYGRGAGAAITWLLGDSNFQPYQA